MYEYIRALKHLVEESRVIFATHANATQDTRHRVPVFRFVSFRSIPFHSIPSRSILFCSVPFRSIPFTPFAVCVCNVHRCHAITPLTVRYNMRIDHRLRRGPQFVALPRRRLCNSYYIYICISYHIKIDRIMKNKKCIRMIQIFSIVDSFDSFLRITFTY